MSLREKIYKFHGFHETSFTRDAHKWRNTYIVITIIMLACGVLWPLFFSYLYPSIVTFDAQMNVTQDKFTTDMARYMFHMSNIGFATSKYGIPVLSLIGASFVLQAVIFYHRLGTIYKRHYINQQAV
jgi:hypothetical protein